MTQFIEPQPLSSQAFTNSISETQKLVVGLTGGIGSGKTAASDWFAAQGIAVIDADVIAREVVNRGQPALEKIREKFGDWVLTASGEMDRAAVRAHVFAHPEALMTLEAITHPAIREQAKSALQSATSDYVILSAPLLLESAEAGLANLCQRILVIDLPEHLQLTRASKRDEQSEEKIKAVMENQLPRTQRLNHADDVVCNAGSLEELYAQLAPLHNHYQQLAASFNKNSAF